jgi:hypothetical protein
MKVHGYRGYARRSCVRNDEDSGSRYGAFAELEKARLVAKLRHARERIRNERGKCEGRKTRIERAERENNSELVKTLTQAVEMAKRPAGRRPRPESAGRCARSAPSLRRLAISMSAASRSIPTASS